MVIGNLLMRYIALRNNNNNKKLQTLIKILALANKKETKASVIDS